MKGLLEICCGSFEDVKTAWENGANRVELNSALYLGGLTPSLANLLCAKEQCVIRKKNIRPCFWMHACFWITGRMGLLLAF